jgi:hypothetical protein
MSDLALVFSQIQCRLLSLVENRTGILQVKIFSRPFDDCFDLARVVSSNIAWTPSQASNATGPVSSRRPWPTSATAALRPTMAMMPLSKYRKGLGDLPEISARMAPAQYVPACCATDASCSSDSPSTPAIFAKSPRAYTHDSGHAKRGCSVGAARTHVSRSPRLHRHVEALGRNRHSTSIAPSLRMHILVVRPSAQGPV